MGTHLHPLLASNPQSASASISAFRANYIFVRSPHLRTTPTLLLPPPQSDGLLKNLTTPARAADRPRQSHTRRTSLLIYVRPFSNCSDDLAGFSWKFSLHARMDYDTVHIWKHRGSSIATCLRISRWHCLGQHNNAVHEEFRRFTRSYSQYLDEYAP